MENEKRIVEINGVKLEVDFRTAKSVESYKVGDPIKVLKKSYSDSYESYVGVIVGFDNFEKLPTIIIAYLKKSYADIELAYVYFNAQSEDVEICPSCEHDVGLTKSSVVERFDQEITTEQLKVAELIKKKQLFLKHFGKVFGEQ
jgi:hypothetical protein